MTDIVRTQPITISRGQDFTLNVTIYTPDTLTNGVVVRSTTPQNIAGMTFVLTIARNKNGTDKLATKTLSTLVTASGAASVTIPSAETVVLSMGSFFYDIHRTDSGYTEPVVKGTCVITGNARYPTS